MVSYELRGDSLDAAVALDLRLRAFFARHPVAVNGRPLLDIHADVSARYQAALKEIAQDDPDLLRRCGLRAPAVQVETADGAQPRTYETFPAIFRTSAKAPLYLMFCPVDYKGKHFTPADAVVCADADFSSTDMGHGIYKKQFWIDEGPVVDGGRRGLPLPADFDPQTSDSVKAHGLRPQYCFRAGPGLRYTLDLHKRTEELFSRTWRAFTDAAQDWTSKNYPGHHMGFMMGEDKALEVYLGDSGLGPHPVLNHADWIVERHVERDWRNPQTGAMERVKTGHVIARPNPATAEGLKLYELFKAIPKPPRTHDYPELAIPSAGGPRYPVVHHHPQGIYLAYHGFKDTEVVRPPAGAIAVDPAELIWLDRDRYDRSLGIIPPPPPKALAHLYPAPPATQGPRTPQP